MIELQCKYQQFIPDSWGGRTERGSRDLAVIGFNILEGIVLEIREVNTTTSFRDWAEPNLNRLRWDGLLIHAVIDFGRACQAREVTLPSASSGVGGARPQSGLVKPAELQAELEARYDGNAKAFGFGYDAGRGSFVLNLAADVRPIPSSATSRSAGAGGATSPA
jgi:hypothetical protein